MNYKHNGTDYSFGGELEYFWDENKQNTCIQNNVSFESCSGPWTSTRSKHCSATWFWYFYDKEPTRKQWHFFIRIIAAGRTSTSTRPNAAQRQQQGLKLTMLILTPWFDSLFYLLSFFPQTTIKNILWVLWYDRTKDLYQWRN